jgi:cystathionine beta-lyase/cystathionine gamma-synthase
MEINMPTPETHSSASIPPPTQPVVPPIYQTVNFRLDENSYDDIRATGGLNEYWYSRFGNPTVDAAGAEVARLEGAEGGLMTSSGMAAISVVLLTLLKGGDRLVAARELYGDTRDLMERDLRQLGITVDLVGAADLDGWRHAVERAPVAVLYAESISNPQLRLLDVPALADLAREAGARLVVDNTFATPLLIRPLEHGADVVIDSVTKFLNGHSDVTAGCISAAREQIQEFQRRVITLGGSLDPHAAFLVSRALRTVQLRLDRQMSTAARVAQFLESRPDVVDVIYPGLPTYPQRELAARLLPGGRAGGMVTFVVYGGNQRGYDMMRRLRVLTEATSLGGVETLVSMPITSSQFNLSEEELTEAGIPPGMVRLSVGIEEPEDIIGDLAQALDASGRQ